ncbi:MAG: DNA alkylation repair protein [Bacillota bacterium]|jgi:3-methyladenine DNA glycosylase AlkD
MALSVDQLIDDLRQAADPVKAEGMSAYQKHRFAFFGVQTPERRAIGRRFLLDAKHATVGEIFAAVEQLYAQPQRECHYLAIDLLERSYRRFRYQEFQLLYPLIDRHAWWDSVDALRKVISLWVKGHPQYLNEVMERLLAADSIWQRRVAITLQLLWKEQTDTAWLCRAILSNIDEGEFFIQKAIGWALRDYAKTNPAWVRRFLARHQLSKLAVREGSKHL